MKDPAAKFLQPPEKPNRGGTAAVNVGDVGPPELGAPPVCPGLSGTDPDREPRGDGEEEDGLSGAAARLEEGGSDQEVRAERRKERRLLLQSDREKVPEQAAAGPLPGQRRGPGLLRLPDREDDARKTAEEQAAVPTRRTEHGQGRQTGPEHGSAHQTDGVHLQTARYQGYQSPRKQGEDGPAESRGAAATAVLGEASDGPAVVGHHRAGSAQHGPAQRPARHRAGRRRRRPAVGHRQRPAHELGADHGSDVGGGREEPGHLAEHDPAALQALHRDGRADPGSGAEGVPGPPQPGGGADGRWLSQSRRKLPGTAAGKDGLKTDRVLLSTILRVSSFNQIQIQTRPAPTRTRFASSNLPQVPQLRKPFIRLDPEQLRRIQTSNQSLEPAFASR